ncbi:MAG: hypothetical protein FWD52_08170 [Candidatus Bathyarchaeota archaeon]|nr:hypothetical protein [Candidatus Termiticorpusculum sp.]
MNPNVNTKHNTHNKKTLLLTLLLIAILLITTTLIIGKLTERTVVDVLFDTPVSLEKAVLVTSEKELKTAVNNAQSKTSKAVIIALDDDIALTETLTIPKNKRIILTSNNNNNNGEGVRGDAFFKLMGANEENTITVCEKGGLRIAGIIVTHAKGDRGRGAYVEPYGTLILSYGKISDNMYHSYAGVVNWGTFIMCGGEVSYNNATGRDTWGNLGASRGGSGGGVYNCGAFIMNGGEIKNNVSMEYGGGVRNMGNFVMSGGEISYNTASAGGGVANGDIFVMSGGEISYNTATWRGGGVSSNNSDANMFKGRISDNNAERGPNLLVVDENGKTIINK